MLTTNFYEKLYRSMSKRSKMKIVLVLLSCLVAVSYQQRFSFTPRIGYLPYWYGVLPNGQHVLLDSESESDADSEGEYNVLGRSKLSQVAQQRLFLANPFNFLNMLGLSGNSIVTSTFWTKSVSTVTTTTIQLCIPLDSFADDGGNPAKSSTGACARRRREVALVEDIMEAIRPTETKQVETSAVPEMAQERHDDMPLLVSSKDEIENTPLRRAARALPVTVTVTSTSVLYTFPSTIVQKTLTSLGGGLGCLPPGLAVCS